MKDEYDMIIDLIRYRFSYNLDNLEKYDVDDYNYRALFSYLANYYDTISEINNMIFECKHYVEDTEDDGNN